MQETKLKLLFLGLVFIFFNNQAQAQEFYTNETGLNSLVFTDKNNLKIAYFFPSPDQGGKILLGYSPIKHLSIEGGFINTNIEFEENNIFHALKGKSYSANVGFYNTFDFSARNSREESDTIKTKKVSLNSSLRIGYTYGNMDSQTGRFQSRFTSQRLFAQIGFGFDNGLIGFNMFLKYNRLNFLDGEVIIATANRELAKNAEALQERNYFNMVEYKIRVHCGYGFAKGVLGMAFEFNIDGNEKLDFLEQGYPYVGLVLELDKVKSTFKKKTKN